MLILALETSTEAGSCALWQDDKVIERRCPAGQSHSATLLPLVRELLAEAACRIGDLDAVAFGCGPGAFTGLRVACAAAQGLAEAAGKPLKPSLIVDAFFGTLIRMAEHEALGGRTFLRLIGRTMTEPSGFIRAFFAEEYAGVVDRYKQALFKALPDVPKAEIVWRFHFMLGATSYAIAGTDALRIVTDWGIEPQEAEEGLDKLLPRLMSFLLGGLRAQLPQFES